MMMRLDSVKSVIAYEFLYFTADIRDDKLVDCQKVIPVLVIILEYV
jgi:hypothetical protein